MAKYNEISGKLINVTGDKTDPSFDHIVAGTDVIYDSEYPLILNGYVECNTTPISDPTGNPHEQSWCEEEIIEGAGTGKYILTEDTTVELDKSYYKPLGARQNAINNQLRTTLSDLSGVVLHANEYNEATIHEDDNPQANGWYELSGTTYVLTTDTTVVSGKTYYIRVAKITSNEDKIIGKEDGYIPTAGAVGRALGANFEDNLQSTSTVKGLTANMGKVLNETKANKNGWYEQLVSGASLSLIGDEVDEKATFIERETGDSTATGGINHSVDKGTATIETIYGNTMKWNQLISLKNAGYTSTGIYITSNEEYQIIAIDINGTTLSSNTPLSQFLSNIPTLKIGDRYYVKVTLTSGSITNGECGLRFGGYTTSYDVTIDTSKSKDSKLISYDADVNVIRWSSNLTGTNLRVKLQIINVTDILGGNLAGNITTQQFEAMFPLDYYDYTPGSLISLNPDSLVSKCGYNIFMGNYDTTPQFVSKSYINDTYDVISNSGYNLFKIQVKPSTTYFVCSDSNSNLGNSANIRFLDSEGNYISGNNTGKTSSSKSFDTPSNCKYIHFCVYVQFIGNFCINISDIEKNGTYEPYCENEIDLKWINEVEDPTDSTGNRKLFQYGVGNADDFYDIVTKNILIKKTHEVDLGNISTWYAELFGDFYRYRCSQPEITIISTYNKLICSHYAVSTNDIGANQPDKSIKIYNGFCIVDSSLSPSDIVNGRIEKLNGVRVRYAIKTPITVEVSEELNYKVEDGGTEKLLPENTSTPTTSALVADIRYPLNALNAIRNLQNNFVPRAELYTIFNSLCDALGNTITFNTETARFEQVAASNTQSIEEPNETI